jgi:hypothetical protein
MHGATPGRDQLSRYTSEAEKLCGLENIRIRRPCKKAIPSDMKKYLSVEHKQFYLYNKHQQDALFTSIIYLYMSQAGLLLIVRRYSQQPVNINT